MADLQTKPMRFSNKGLLLKSEPASTPDDYYQELTNLVSNLEGALATRGGSAPLSTAAVGDCADIYKLRVTLAGYDYYYLNINGTILRSPNPISNPLSSLAGVPVASGVSVGSPYPQERIGSDSYSAGTVGTAYQFFGGNQKMLKDNGALTNLQNWGIIPPTIPAQAFVSAATLIPTTDLVAAAGAATRLSGVTVIFVTAVSPTLYTITPSSMNGIYVGMLLTIGGQLANCLSTTSTTFQVYLANAPLPTQAITSGFLQKTAPATFPTINATLDAAFNGVANDGYSTDDCCHISISVSDPNDITDIRFRVLVNGSASDYYEKSIMASQIQSQISLQTTAIASLPGVADNVDQGVLGNYDIVDPSINTAKPQTLGPYSPVSLTHTVWAELDIPKSQFTAVGNAGQGPYSWINVTGFQVVYTYATSTTPTIAISSIYFHGGQGPNAVTITNSNPLLPYRYVYCFINPVTGAPSNPSVEMLQSLAVYPQNAQVEVTVYGTGDPQVSGVNSIGIFRSGGAFADDYYRLVGYVQNPGAGVIANFYDNQADINISSATVALFDNDAPVSSTLTTPVQLSYAAGSMGPGLVTLTVGIITAPAGGIAVLTPGTPLTVALNTPTQETANLISVVGNLVTLWLQYAQSFTAGQNIIQAGYIVGAPANLVLTALDSVFVAGDANNPQVLYKSKVGRPEAFPIEDIEGGFANQINVGTPSDYIVNFVEYEGYILCLNSRSLYLVPLFQGAMQAPQKTDARRGLLSRKAWVKKDNEIWYLSYDGIYTWAGGESILRTLDLDPLFKGMNIGNYAAIDLSDEGNQYCEMAFNDNEIFMTYRDVNGNSNRLRYHTILKRWSVEYYNGGGGGQDYLEAMYADIDTGNFLISRVGKTSSSVIIYQDNIGTTDGDVAVPFAVTPGTMTFNEPAMEKSWSDFVLEANTSQLTPLSTVTIQTFYDYEATADPTDVFSVPIQSGRDLYPFTFHQGQGVEGYAISQRYFGTGAVILYSLSMSFLPLAKLSVGSAFDWTDLGYPCEKLIRQLILEVDTGGVTATVQIYADGVAVGPLYRINTTYANRNVILSVTNGPGTLQSDVLARMVRFVGLAGPGGQFNYYKHDWNTVREPCYATIWDSFEFTFGYNGDSFVKQGWLEYICQSPILVTFYVDDGQQFYQLTLPAHPKRDVERFYFPAGWLNADSGVAVSPPTITVLNKSFRKRFTIQATNVANQFKFYKDASRLEWMPVGPDQRPAYAQFELSSLQQLAI